MAPPRVGILGVFVRTLRCLVVAAALAIAGCSGLSQVQDSISKFDQGAHSVATAQMTFLRSVRAVDCQDQYIQRLHDFAVGSIATIDLSGACTPKAPSDQETEIRQKLMDALTLYADKLQALATGGDSKTLGSNSQTLATNLNGFAALGGFKASSIGADAEAAVIAIAQMALDQHVFNSVRAAAAAEQNNITQIASALKGENLAAANVVGIHLNRITENMALVARAARAQQGPAVFYLILSSPSTVQAVSTFGTGDAATAMGAAAQLNEALDSFVKANAAIATADSGGIVAAVKDLIARGQAAQTMASALAK